MKHFRHILTSVLLTAMLVCGSPTISYAAPDQFTRPILITEMSAGTAVSASQEFIELYNQSAHAIDLTAGGWQLQLTSSKATSWDKPKTVILSGILYPGTYLIAASNYIATGDTQSYLQQYASAQFSAGLTNTSGHIRLVRTAGATITDDVLEWSTLDTNGLPISAPIDGMYVQLASPLGPTSSIKRRANASGLFSDTSNLQNDFLVSDCPSPTSTNSMDRASTASTEPVPTTIDITNQSCAPTDTKDDPGQSSDGVSAPQSEPPAILLPSDSQTATTSGPSVQIPQIPIVDIGQASPSITELLPNPGSPQTDAKDEFVELYNGNDQTFDLTGFELRAGLTGNKKYVFPVGTSIEPHTFKAFFSSDTKLSLSNTSGKVALYDPLGKLLVQTDEYNTAKDNAAWALADGSWQWTKRPTPNTTNIIIAPVAKKPTKAKSASSTQKNAVKAAAKKPTHVTSVAASNMQMASNVEQKASLHPLALAVVGGFALLYGAYEYRYDVANKFYQLRSNRAARRKNRQGPTRR